MKRRTILLLAMMLVVSVIGGNSLLAKENLVKHPGDLVDRVAGGQVAKGSPKVIPTQGITVNTIQFEEVRNLNQLPEPVQEMVKNHRKERGYDYWRSEAGVFYLAVFAGEKKTGGYGIEVVRIEDNEGVTNVTIQEKTPGKGAMVTMAITYPYTVVKFTGTTDQFQLFMTSGQKLTKDGETIEIIPCPTGNVTVQSALDERIKTMQLIAETWANRLRELDQLLDDSSLTVDQHQILADERIFVKEEWQKALLELKSVFQKSELGH